MNKGSEKKRSVVIVFVYCYFERYLKLAYFYKLWNLHLYEKNEKIILVIIAYVCGSIASCVRLFAAPWIVTC